MSYKEKVRVKCYCCNGSGKKSFDHVMGVLSLGAAYFIDILDRSMNAEASKCTNCDGAGVVYKKIKSSG